MSPAPSLPNLAELRPERLQQPPTRGIRIERDGSIRFVNPHHASDGRFEDEPKDGESSGEGREDNEDGKGKGAAPAPPETEEEEDQILQNNQVDDDASNVEEDATRDRDAELQPTENGKSDTVDVGKEPECRRQVGEFFFEEDGRTVATFPVDAYWNAESQKGPGVANPGFAADDYAAIKRHFATAGAAFANVNVRSLQMRGVGFGIGESDFFRELVDATGSQCTFLYTTTVDREWGNTDAQWPVGKCPDGRIRALLKLVRGADRDQLNYLAEVFATISYTLELSAAVAVDDDGPETSVYRTVESMLVWLPKRATDQIEARAHAVSLVTSDADAFLNERTCKTLVANQAGETRIGGNEYTALWMQYYYDGAKEDGAERENAVLSNRFLGDLFGLWWATRKLVYGDLDDARISKPAGVGAFRKVWNAVEWTPATDVVRGDAGNFADVARLRFPLPPFTVILRDTEDEMKLACPSRPIVQTVVQMKSPEVGTAGAVGLSSFGSAYVGLLFNPQLTPLRHEEEDNSLAEFCEDVAQMGMHAILQVLEVTTSPWSGTRFCSLYKGMIDNIDPDPNEAERVRLRDRLDVVVDMLRAKRDKLLSVTTGFR